MAIVSMKALLESGVHFGHRTNKWHPSMKPYIFTERNGIHIVNLQLTVKALDKVYGLVRDTAAGGGTMLFVGTKRQAQETIQNEAIRCEMPYVTARWLGGFLTNWRTIRESISELERLERMRDRGDFERVTKKEALMLTRKIDKLETRLGGIRNMVNIPDLLFVVDVRREETAIHEANLLDIPVIAMVDTNCDPRNVDYVVPSNDDAIRAIKLMVSKMADAVLEGRDLRKEEELEEEAVNTARVLVEEEPELADEDLLGAATLAKIKSAEEDEASTVIEEAEEPTDSAVEETEVEEEERPAKAEELDEEAGEPADSEAEGAEVEDEDAGELAETDGQAGEEATESSEDEEVEEE